MIAGIESNGLVTSKEYARKWGVSIHTVLSWLLKGTLSGYKVGKYWRIDPDTPPPLKRSSPGTKYKWKDGRLKCSVCRRFREKHFYSKSSLAKARCMDCVNFLERRRNGSTSPETLSYAQDVEIWQWLDTVSPAIKKHRQAELERHAARIEAMGLAGDGKDWPDGED